VISTGERYIRVVKVFKMATIWGLAVLAGVFAGLWGASVTYPCFGLCLAGTPALAAWQSCLIGAIVGLVIPTLAMALDGEFLASTLGAVRAARRFLFEDLSRDQAQ
jgi:hypothetical protein